MMIGETLMVKNIMEFQHVSKQYDDNVVLRDISFEIEAGKFYTSRIVAMSFCEPRVGAHCCLPKTAWPPTL